MNTYPLIVSENLVVRSKQTTLQSSAKTTSIPLVARLATEENIAANVISASTQKLSEEIYGSMLLGVPAAQFDRAWEFLSGIENLQVEEASVGVQ